MNETQKQVAAVLLHSVGNGTATAEQEQQILEYIGVPKMSGAPASKGSFHDLCEQVSALLHNVSPGWHSAVSLNEDMLTSDGWVLAMCSALRQLSAGPEGEGVQIADVYHAGSDSHYKAMLLQKLTAEDVNGFDNFMDSDESAGKPCPIPGHPHAIDANLDEEDGDEDEDVPRPRKIAGKSKTKRDTPPETPTNSIALVLEAWDHGQFGLDFLKKYGFFAPVHTAFTEVLTWLTYDHTRLKYLPPDSMAKKVEPVPEPKLNRLNEALAKFYNVDSDQELIEAQARSIVKLQDEVMTLKRPPALPRRARGF